MPRRHRPSNPPSSRWRVPAGAAAAPVVTGAILTATDGNYTFVFLIGGVLLLVGALSYGLFVKDRSTVA